ncbi:hypothetical protein [Yoonia sp. 2307UL14-13]|uniref:hypothetical protein n=1 Tax=Yoonia sp. 2307UL14-13 TaxID=3126506 RepID=UPI0030ABE54E
MNMKNIAIYPIFVIGIGACTETTTLPTPTPPESASAEEVVAFYSAVCTQRGIPKLTIEEAAAQGDPRAAFAHQACIDRFVIEDIQRRQAAT